MPIKTAQFKIQGMNQDNSESAFPEKFAFEIRNMRIDARNDNTLLSLTNEKGNALIKNELHQSYVILGYPIGYAVINNYIVLFTHNPTTGIDYIYKVYTEGLWLYTDLLFSGNLDFSENWKEKKPLETLAWYESEDIQKIYWIDGIHQPRLINIVSNEYPTNDDPSIYDGFDFSRHLGLEEEVAITQGDNGQFHSGMVQYFITYHEANGIESRIAWQSPLMYVMYKERGGSPENIVPKSFTLNFSGVDTNFEKMRLYCVQRTTLNGEVYVRLVHEFKVEDMTPEPFSFTDNGVVGESVDPTYLIYVGGDELIAGCFTQKDQVLFYGDITIKNQYLFTEGLGSINVEYKTVPEDAVNAALGKYYHHFQQENKQSFEDIEDNSQIPVAAQSTQGNESISTFKYLETYRFGIQFQFDNGQWSNVLYVDDWKIDKRIKKNSADQYQFAMPVIFLTTQAIADLNDDLEHKIVKVRPVCVFPSEFERDVICQGILCPTVYNVSDRVTGKTFSYSSWFSRPNSALNIIKEYDTTDPDNPVVIQPGDVVPPYTAANYPTNPYAVRTSDFKDKGCWAEFRHNFGLPSPRCFNGEIQMQFAEDGGMAGPLLPSDPHTELNTPYKLNDYYSNGFNIDQSIITMHSPDIEFADNIKNVALYNAKLRIIGYVPIDANSGDIYLDATSPDNYVTHKISLIDNHIDTTDDIPSSRRPDGFYKEKVGVKVNSEEGWFNLINGPYWQDRLYNPSYHEDVAPGASVANDNLYSVTGWFKFGFVVYPWQQHGSLSNGEPDNDSSILKRKIISNLKYSLNTRYFSTNIGQYGDAGYWTSFNSGYDNDDTGLSDVVYIDDIDHFALLKSPYDTGNISYDGNMDKILPFTRNDWSPKMVVFEGRDARLLSPPYDCWYIKPDYEWLHAAPDTWWSWKPDIGHSTGTYDIVCYRDDNTDHFHNTRSVYTKEETYAMCNTTGNFIEGLDLQQTINEQYYYAKIPSKYYMLISPGHGSYWIDYKVSNDQPIQMRYKCSPHIVMALNNQSAFNGLTNLQRCLPVSYRGRDLNDVPYVTNPISYTFVDENEVQDFNGKQLYFDPKYGTGDQMQGCMQSYVAQANFSYLNENHGFYWLAELYRDDIQNKFGGDSEEALSNNVWYVCGKAVKVDWTEQSQRIECTEGDTFYQRYDHLKTKPYADDDENQVIEIVSFMCESRVNLDGRYDKLRGVDSAELILPDAFNSINTVYSQLDNYLTQVYMKEEDIHYNLPNSIIWTDKKINREHVDMWTQLHTENYLDLEGKNGKINALKTFRNEVYAFQDSAIANILFNSRTALATTEGSPVQLATTGLVEGKQYLTNSMGCLNKWSICETPMGLVFIDDLNAAIMNMGDGFENISEKYGMSTWVRNNCKTVPWDLDFSNTVTYYDRNNKDILFVTRNEALAFSIKLGNFTSFYSYGGTPFIANYNNYVLDIIGVQNSFDENYYTQLWKQNLGDYNKFYGNFEPFDITLIVRENPTTDKIFNTIEYRADFYNQSGVYEASNTFSSMRAWNEYQDTNDYPITNVTTYLPNDVKKKFRMWRLNIPRNYGTMDRIRNPWTYIKLEKDTTGYTGNMQLHDIQVHYTE